MGVAEDRKLTRLQLGLLVLYGAEGSRGASPYGVEKLIASRVGGVLGFGKSSCYVQTKRLAEDGYLSATVVEKGSAPSLTLYRLTDKGRREVERWVRTRAQAPPIDSEAFVRVRAASFVDPLAVMNGLRYLRPELTRRLAALDATEAELGRRVPPVYELLERDLARSVLKTYLAWLGRTEKALAREVRMLEDDH